MVLYQFFANNWYWFFAGYALAFAFIVAGTVFYGLRDERAKLAADSGTDSGADSDSDRDCRANLDAAVNRLSGRRAIPNPGPWNPAGRRAADSDPVLTDAKAVA